MINSGTMNIVDLHTLSTAPRVERVEVSKIRRDVPDPWQLRVVLCNGESRVFRAAALHEAADEAKLWLSK